MECNVAGDAAEALRDCYMKSIVEEQTRISRPLD
jgi:hypothetical protein